jgi:DNA polymerase III epsilon subunit-like protein
VRPVLVFDTETTGLSASDVVIQLGYVYMLSNGTVLNEYEKVLHSSTPSNPFALRVHKISNETVRRSPHDAHAELRKFMDLANRVLVMGGALVAHNAAFDVRLLRQTAMLVGLHEFQLDSVFCTAKALKKIPTSERGATCKNTDVYRCLGGHKMDMHNALNDAKATAFIYLHGLQAGWW